MIQCLHPSQRPILVAASDTLDAALARSAIEELGLIPVLVQDAAETIRQLSGGARRYSALVAGERGIKGIRGRNQDRPLTRVQALDHGFLLRCAERRTRGVEQA